MHFFTQKCTYSDVIASLNRKAIVISVIFHHLPEQDI